MKKNNNSGKTAAPVTCMKAQRIPPKQEVASQDESSTMPTSANAECHGSFNINRWLIEKKKKGDCVKCTKRGDWKVNIPTMHQPCLFRTWIHVSAFLGVPLPIPLQCVCVCECGLICCRCVGPCDQVLVIWLAGKQDFTSVDPGLWFPPLPHTPAELLLLLLLLCVWSGKSFGRTFCTFSWSCVCLLIVLGSVKV